MKIIYIKYTLNVYLMYICKKIIMYINTKSYKKYILSKRITRLLTILFSLWAFIMFLEKKGLPIWFNLVLVIILGLFMYYGITSAFYLYYSTTSIDDPPLITDYKIIENLKKYESHLSPPESGDNKKTGISS